MLVLPETKALNDDGSINLDAFIDTEDIRVGFCTPFRHNGKIFAVNAHFILGIAEDGRHELSHTTTGLTESFLNKAEEYINTAPGPTWYTVHDVLPSIPAPKPCAHCSSGTVWVRICGCEIGCELCDDEGCFTFKEPQPGAEPDACEYCGGIGIEDRPIIPVQVGQAWFQLKYLHLLVKLPGFEIAPATDTGPSAFRFDGGAGAIMPIDPKRARALGVIPEDATRQQPHSVKTTGNEEA